MVLPNFLQQLCDLDSASPQFYEHLGNFLRGDEYRNAIPNLQGEDLAQFVEYLSGALVEVTDYKSPEFLESLRELGRICAVKQVLPKSWTLGDSKVRIKHIRVYTERDPQKVKETFHQVAITWKNLAHPNIVPLLGVTTEPLQLVSDWMSGGCLSGYIKNYPGADRLGLISDVAEGLGFLHSCNVVHGDLNVSNILVDATGGARITDFGLATISDSQWMCNKEGDVFAFAMIMVVAFSDASPFNEGSPRVVALDIAGDQRPPRPTHPTLTDKLWALIQRCWNHEAALRPQSSEVLRILRKFGPPTWKRLVKSPFVTRESIPLITTIFSDKAEIGVVERLPKDDVQTFIDRAAEVLDLPGLATWLRNGCLTTLCKICGKLAVLPGSLRIPQCYDRRGAPPARGGYSEVWKGVYQGRHVAVKVLKIYSNSDLGQVTLRFCREVLRWKVLDHPNVIPLMGVTMDDHQFAMVSEWMVNGNINQYIMNHGEANRFELLQDVTRGLIYIHGRSMVHGDLKGANILIDGDGHARLADFGLLTILSDPRYNTTSSSSAKVGTMKWMSPELFDPGETSSTSGKKKPTKESDCYALGMTAYEVLSGKVPFASHSNLTTMQKVLNGKRPGRPKGMERAWFTVDLWEMLKQSWATQPTDRPKIEAMLELFVQGSNTWELPPPQVEEEDSAGAWEDVEMGDGIREGGGVESDEGPETDEDPGPDDPETDVEVPAKVTGKDRT